MEVTKWCCERKKNWSYFQGNLQVWLLLLKKWMLHQVHSAFGLQISGLRSPGWWPINVSDRGIAHVGTLTIIPNTVTVHHMLLPDFHPFGYFSCFLDWIFSPMAWATSFEDWDIWVSVQWQWNTIGPQNKVVSICCKTWDRTNPWPSTSGCGKCCHKFTALDWV